MFMIAAPSRDIVDYSNCGLELCRGVHLSYVEKGARDKGWRDFKIRGGLFIHTWPGICP